MGTPYQKLQSLLRGYGALAVAYTGGTDSTLLLKVAADTLTPQKVLALTAISPLYVSGERQTAAALAAELGVRRRVFEVDPLTRPEVAGNASGRCYHCKRLLFGRLWEEARAAGFSVLADGTNLSDLEGYRPGLRALRELEVKSPLREAGLTKENIRTLSQRLGLPTSKSPAGPCLATRVPYDTRLSVPLLRRIEAAEQELRRRGFYPCRVRDHESIARIEVPRDDIPRLLACGDVQEALKKLGYRYVTVDMDGFRSGSFDFGIVKE